MVGLDAQRGPEGPVSRLDHKMLFKKYHVPLISVDRNSSCGLPSQALSASIFKDQESRSI